MCTGDAMDKTFTKKIEVQIDYAVTINEDN